MHTESFVQNMKCIYTYECIGSNIIHKASCLTRSELRQNSLRQNYPSDEFSQLTAFVGTTDPDSWIN